MEEDKSGNIDMSESAVDKKRKSRELGYLNTQNILADQGNLMAPAPVDVKMTMFEIIQERKLAKLQQLNNLDSLKIPCSVGSLYPN